ncbi:general secretion pathway protein GspA [Psychromonas sp. psych-6C06]|uniref:AAA family ATPase n=1 Tax=Psychromonas sp. psych-6C06 TaxID=2058089 RepID=UPI000C33F542|nr:AAA family ATPase [Psychromonas sp. psych-6C06]PKF61690.1 general secretion pathway protein GspA [Psychromonas sp. psych-6C06]
MYQEFFSLKIKPFSISPDPNFLFLSERHKEAIDHLKEGLKGHGGFALLTGEVGTGKTTICRSLVEHMSDDSDIAFILNPALSEIELLSTICDSFNIQYQKNNLRSLFNELTTWMIANCLQNRHTIVIIDEAQHLSFAALEQLRLLTNIETNDKKPLQVILIGQTELQEKLKQAEFRQLAQRITARYHLLSLTQQESNLYIQHRLNIAGSMHAIFDKSALQEIFRKCKGTPRLTNILCDRSLLAAYTEDSHIVTLKMVKQASREVHFEHHKTKSKSLLTKWRIPALVALIALTLWQAPQIIQRLIPDDALVTLKKSLSFDEQEHVALGSEWFNAYPQLDLSNSNYQNALTSLYSVWGYQVNSNAISCQQNNSALMNCYERKVNLEQLKQLNYPSVIRLANNNKDEVYAVIYKIADNYQLLINGNLIYVTEAWFQQYWTGESTLIWKAPFPLNGAIKFGQEGEKVTWLANQLNKEQGWSSENKTRFDLRLLEQVSAFQREQGLMDDGIVGPRTLMPLMQIASPDSPRLLQEAN